MSRTSTPPQVQSPRNSNPVEPSTCDFVIFATVVSWARIVSARGDILGKTPEGKEWHERHTGNRSTTRTRDADRAAAVEKVDAFKNQLARAIKAFMVTSSERVFNGSGKGYPPAGTIGNRTHILSERLKAGTEFKRLKKEHRPAPMPLK